MSDVGEKLLSVSNLRVEITGGQGVILDDVSLDIEAGQVLGVVGESGSGKTTLALSLFGYSRRGTRITGGRIRVKGVDVLGQSQSALTAVRGRLLSYVPQDPGAALNPGRRIGDQLGEAVTAVDPSAKAKGVSARSLELLESVQLPANDAFLRRYPHQLSGGQLQRVVIAMALAGHPPLLVMDEPTTALDVTTQARVLSLVKLLAARQQLGIVYVTHDLAVVAHMADQIAVMYAGAVVEAGTASSILGRPLHPYTRGLVAAAPEVDPDSRVRGISGRAPDPRARGRGCLFAPRCAWAQPACTVERPALSAYTREDSRAACIRIDEIGGASWQGPAGAAGATATARLAGDPTAGEDHEDRVLTARDILASYRGHEVLHGVSLGVRAGQCVAVVGESGSGKTTLARTICGLHKEASGDLRLGSQALGYDSRMRPLAARLAIQYVFQNPYASLNPRRTVAKCLAQPLRFVPGLAAAQMKARVRSAMEQVELPLELLASYPDELSGGQRQRVAIARALVVEPSVLVCDEVTSALDVSVQASVVEMLLSLKDSRGLAILFITHNIALASGIADEVAVLRGGHLVEHGATAQVVLSPRSEYAQTLLKDTPSLEAPRSA
jgi:peptide/nickel transport system ATP-binding protein